MAGGVQPVSQQKKRLTNMVRAFVAEAMAKEDPGQTMFTLFKVGRFDLRNVKICVPQPHN